MFAPHYAAPLDCRIAAAVTLRESGAADAAPLASLAAGERFELLELAGGNAWGIAPAHGLVGYIDAAALEGQPAA